MASPSGIDWTSDLDTKQSSVIKSKSGIDWSSPSTPKSGIDWGTDTISTFSKSGIDWGSGTISPVRQQEIDEKKQNEALIAKLPLVSYGETSMERIREDEFHHALDPRSLLGYIEGLGKGMAHFVVGTPAATTRAVWESMKAGDIDVFTPAFHHAQEHLHNLKIAGVKPFAAQTYSGQATLDLIGRFFQWADTTSKNWAEKYFNEAIANGVDPDKAARGAVLRETGGNALALIAPFGLSRGGRVIVKDRIPEDMLSRDIGLPDWLPERVGGAKPVAGGPSGKIMGPTRPDWARAPDRYERPEGTGTLWRESESLGLELTRADFGKNRKKIDPKITEERIDAEWDTMNRNAREISANLHLETPTKTSIFDPIRTAVDDLFSGKEKVDIWKEWWGNPNLDKVTNYISGLQDAQNRNPAIAQGRSIGAPVAGPSPISGIQWPDFIKYAQEGGDIFLDSGAYSAYRQSKTTGKDIKIDFEKVMNKYEDIVRQARKGKDTLPGTIKIVAPDVIGNQKATHDLLRKYAPRLRTLMDDGADILVSLQKGEFDPAANLKITADIIGQDMPRISIPLKERAYEVEEVGRIFEGSYIPTKFHLLGISPKNSKFEQVVNIILEKNPKADISADAATEQAVARRWSRAYEVRIDDIGEYHIVKGLSTQKMSAAAKLLKKGTDQYDFAMGHLKLLKEKRAEKLGLIKEKKEVVDLNIEERQHKQHLENLDEIIVIGNIETGVFREGTGWTFKPFSTKTGSKKSLEDYIKSRAAEKKEELLYDIEPATKYSWDIPKEDIQMYLKILKDSSNIKEFEQNFIKAIGKKFDVSETFDFQRLRTDPVFRDSLTKESRKDLIYLNKEISKFQKQVEDSRTMLQKGRERGLLEVFYEGNAKMPEQLKIPFDKEHEVWEAFKQNQILFSSTLKEKIIPESPVGPELKPMPFDIYRQDPRYNTNKKTGEPLSNESIRRNWTIYSKNWIAPGYKEYYTTPNGTKISVPRGSLDAEFDQAHVVLKLVEDMQDVYASLKKEKQGTDPTTKANPKNKPEEELTKKTADQDAGIDPDQIIQAKEIFDNADFVGAKKDLRTGKVITDDQVGEAAQLRRDSLAEYRRAKGELKREERDLQLKILGEDSGVLNLETRAIEQIQREVPGFKEFYRNNKEIFNELFRGLDIENNPIAVTKFIGKKTLDPGVNARTVNNRLYNIAINYGKLLFGKAADFTIPKLLTFSKRGKFNERTYWATLKKEYSIREFDAEGFHSDRIYKNPWFKNPNLGKVPGDRAMLAALVFRHKNVIAKLERAELRDLDYWQYRGGLAGARRAEERYLKQIKEIEKEIEALHKDFPEDVKDIRLPKKDEHGRSTYERMPQTDLLENFSHESILSLFDYVKGNRENIIDLPSAQLLRNIQAKIRRVKNSVPSINKIQDQIRYGSGRELQMDQLVGILNNLESLDKNIASLLRKRTLTSDKVTFRAVKEEEFAKEKATLEDHAQKVEALHNEGIVWTKGKLDKNSNNFYTQKEYGDLFRLQRGKLPSTVNVGDISDTLLNQIKEVVKDSQQMVVIENAAKGAKDFKEFSEKLEPTFGNDYLQAGKVFWQTFKNNKTSKRPAVEITWNKEKTHFTINTMKTRHPVLGVIEAIGAQAQSMLLEKAKLSPSLQIIMDIIGDYKQEVAWAAQEAGAPRVPHQSYIGRYATAFGSVLRGGEIYDNGKFVIKFEEGLMDIYESYMPKLLPHLRRHLPKTIFGKLSTRGTLVSKRLNDEVYRYINLKDETVSPMAKEMGDRLHKWTETAAEYIKRSGTKDFVHEEGYITRSFLTGKVKNYKVDPESIGYPKGPAMSLTDVLEREFTTHEIKRGNITAAVKGMRERAEEIVKTLSNENGKISFKNPFRDDIRSTDQSAKRMISDLQKEGPRKFVMKKINPNVEMQRHLNMIPRSKLQPWLDTNVHELFVDYAKNITRRGEWISNFGPKNEKLYELILRSMGELNEKGKEMTLQEFNRIGDLAEAHQLIYNQFKPEHLPFKKASKFSTVAGNIILLPYVVIKSFPEAAMPLYYGGIKAYVRAMPKVAGDAILSTGKLIWKDFDGAGLSKSTGMEISEAIVKSATTELTEMLNKMYSGDFSVVSNYNFRLNGLVYWVNAMNKLSINVYDIMWSNYFKDINKGKYDKPGWLRNQENQRMLYLADYYGINVKEGLKWHKNKKPAEGAFYDSYIKGAHRFAEDNVLTPNPGSTPMWHSNPYMQIVRHLKTFPTLMGNKIIMQWYRDTVQKGVMKGNVYMAGRNGTYAFITGVYAMTLAMAAYQLADYIKHGGENPSYDKRFGNKDIGVFVRSFETAGLFGPYNIFFDAFFHSYGQSPTDVIAGPTISKLNTFVQKITNSVTKKNATPLASELAKNTPGINVRVEWSNWLKKNLENAMQEYLGYTIKPEPGERGAKGGDRGER